MGHGIINGKLRRPLAYGALVTVLVGWIFLGTSLGDRLEWLSFDLLTLLNQPRSFPELALIEMDEPSHDHLHQEHGKPWDRRLHAALVDFLTAEGCRQVVFDTEFYERGEDPRATAELAAALQRNGRVVLAAALVNTGKKGFATTTILQRPVPELLVTGVTWAVSWNLPGLKGEEDGVVRLHPVGRDPDPSLPWTAAVAVHPGLTNGGARHDAERWVRHYGPGGTLPRVSYWQATNEAPGFYRDRTVFIGGRPATGFIGQEVDQFRTAWSRWGGSRVSGLELSATAWLNLVRGDWLRRLAPWPEFLALTLFGALVGGTSAIGSIRRAVVVCAGAAGLAGVTAVWLCQSQNLWCNWAVAVLVQVPVALGWRLVSSHLELRREKRWLEAPLEDLFDEGSARLPGSISTPATSAPSNSQWTQPGAAAGAPPIPDYDLLRCVGRGAYGEVWLARDVIGGFRVVKIIRRVAFDDDGPYEREFRGLQKFAPISREHPGLIQVLHVGLNRPGGFFHYVMEVGDDEQSGVKIDPEHYVPRNLSRDLRQPRGRTSAQIVDLGRSLCDALAFLHDRGLIHRDIKPANVIFVNGHPKLADVGLVTELASPLQRVTQVGTQGYIPPEGTGTAAGDVFALGCLLAQTLDSAGARPDEACLALRRILEQAQAPLLQDRFPTARVLGDALAGWQNKYLPPPHADASMPS